MDPPPIKYRRVEGEKGKLHYLVWPPDGRLPVALYSPARAQEFLEKEGLTGIVPLNTFDFRKTPPVKDARKLARSSSCKAAEVVPASHVFDEDDDLVGNGAEGGAADGVAASARRKFNLENILKSNHDCDHKQLLDETARLLESVRFEYDLPDPDGVECERLRLEVAAAPNVEAIVASLGSSKLAMQKMTRLVGGKCLEEMITLSSVNGAQPLADWPIDMSKNWYCEVIRFAYLHSPALLSFLLRLIVKEPSSSVLPRHVLSLATIYAQIGGEVDKANNALALIQGISLKMDGLSDRGLAGQAKVKLSVTERTLRYKRDELAEIQASLLIEESKDRPSQITIDNCNTCHTNCIVAYSQAETEDTSALSSEGSSPEDVMALFSPSVLMLTSPELEVEFDHLEEVAMLSVGRELALHLPDELGHWTKLLPQHHSHPQSHVPLQKANATLLPPMPYEVQYLELKPCCGVKTYD